MMHIKVDFNDHLTLYVQDSRHGETLDIRLTVVTKPLCHVLESSNFSTKFKFFFQEKNPKKSSCRLVVVQHRLSRQGSTTTYFSTFHKLCFLRKFTFIHPPFDQPIWHVQYNGIHKKYINFLIEIKRKWVKDKICRIDDLGPLATAFVLC